MNLEKFIELGFTDSFIGKCGIEWAADELKSFWFGKPRDKVIVALKERKKIMCRIKSNSRKPA